MVEIFLLGFSKTKKNIIFAMPRAFPRRDDMGRKVGMICFAESAGCLDRFVPRDDAKRQWGRSQEKVQRKVFCAGKPNLIRAVRGGLADMGEVLPLCAVGP